jgi:hypothetical protein
MDKVRKILNAQNRTYYKITTHHKRNYNRIPKVSWTCNLKVKAIQEIRWLGKWMFGTRSHTVLYSGKEKGAHEAGVAFIVDKTIKMNTLKFDPISERDCVLRLKTRFFNLSIINAYAPQKTRSS